MNFNDIHIESELHKVVGLYGLYVSKISNIINEQYSITGKTVPIGDNEIFILQFTDKKFGGEIGSILFDFKTNNKYVELIIDNNSIHYSTISKLIDIIAGVIEDFIFTQGIRLVDYSININEIKKLDSYLKRYEF